MSHIIFSDVNGEQIIDRFGYDFLVKSSGIRVLDNMSSDELRLLVERGSMRCTFYLYALWEDETIKEDLSPYLLEGGSMTINYESGIRRKLNVSLFNQKNWTPTPLGGFLWKGSKFRLEIGLQTASAEYIYPAGVFVLQDFEKPHKYQKNEIIINAVDKFGKLDGTVGGKIIDKIYIPRGSEVVQVIKSLLYSIDVKSPVFPPWLYKVRTPYSITKSSDSTIGELIKELTTILNIEAYYDEYGRMCFEEMKENILVDTKPSIWTFSDSENIYDNHSMKVNLQAVENVIEVEGANLNGNIVNVRVENTNPKSPTNITLFEPVICKITDENIANINGAKVRAEYELLKRSLLPISLNFSTVYLPILDVNKVVVINDSYCGLNNARFLINSINIPIGGAAKMDLTISNLEEVAFDGK